MKTNAEKMIKKKKISRILKTFGDMWEEIGDDYEKTISDKTKQDEVTVE